MVSSPFSFINKKTENKLLYLLIFLTLLFGYFMIYFDGFLINNICKNGIISFQLAKDVNLSQAILDSWNTQSKVSAGLSIGLDFLYLLFYPSLIALLIHKLNEILWKNNTFYFIGLILLFAQFFAALFDVIENIALIQLLLGNVKQFWTSVSYYFASIKFIVIFIGIIYILLNFIYFVLLKATKNE